MYTSHTNPYRVLSLWWRNHLSFSVNGANREFLVMRTIIFGTIFVPLDNTALAHIHDNTTRGGKPSAKGEITFQCFSTAPVRATTLVFIADGARAIKSSVMCSRPLGTWSCRNWHDRQQTISCGRQRRNRVALEINVVVSPD